MDPVRFLLYAEINCPELLLLTEGEPGCDLKDCVECLLKK